MSKIYLAEKTQLDSAKTPFATCSTSAATAAKTVYASGFSLKTGAMITVKFTYANTAANPTLNVNSTGAKSIYYHNLAVPAGMFAAGGVYLFVYNGSRWELMGNHFANSGSSSVALLHSGGEYEGFGTHFSIPMDFGALYAQGYRAVLLSMLQIHGNNARCTLSCGEYSQTYSVISSAGGYFSFSTQIPSSGTGVCTATGTEIKSDTLSRTYKYGKIYLLT